jgi:hypothetical protein
MSLSTARLKARGVADSWHIKMAEWAHDEMARPVTHNSNVQRRQPGPEEASWHSNPCTLPSRVRVNVTGQQRLKHLESTPAYDRWLSGRWQVTRREKPIGEAPPSLGL